MCNGTKIKIPFMCGGFLRRNFVILLEGSPAWHMQIPCLDIQNTPNFILHFRVHLVKLEFIYNKSFMEKFLYSLGKAFHTSTKSSYMFVYYMKYSIRRYYSMLFSIFTSKLLYRFNYLSNLSNKRWFIVGDSLNLLDTEWYMKMLTKYN